MHRAWLLRSALQAVILWKKLIGSANVLGKYSSYDWVLCAFPPAGWHLKTPSLYLNQEQIYKKFLISEIGFKLMFPSVLVFETGF